LIQKPAPRARGCPQLRGVQQNGHRVPLTGAQQRMQLHGDLHIFKKRKPARAVQWTTFPPKGAGGHEKEEEDMVLRGVIRKTEMESGGLEKMSKCKEQKRKRTTIHQPLVNSPEPRMEITASNMHRRRSKNSPFEVKDGALG